MSGRSVVFATHRRTGFNRRRRLLLALQRGLNRLPGLAALERRELARASTTEQAAPVFIIGAPRSGSTLLFQLLLRTRRLAYISNAASLFTACPVTATAWSRRFFPAYDGRRLKSAFGYVHGVTAPSEAGPLMDRWFSTDVTAIRDPAIDPPTVNRSMLRLKERMGGTCLFKSLKLGLKIPDLAAAFPRAVFLNITRDPRLNAQSIWLSRRELLQDERQWLGFPVPGQNELEDLEAPEQIVRQIRIIRERIDYTAAEFPPGRWLTLRYHDLCVDPAAALDRVDRACADAGLTLTKTGRDLPSLVPEENIKLENREWRHLEELCRREFG